MLPLTGAEHLYLLDFMGDNLSELKKTIQEKYTGVKVTTTQADAADEDAISAVCRRALEEEGRLDVFFANVLYSARCNRQQLIIMVSNRRESLQLRI